MSSAIYLSHHPAKIFELGHNCSQCGCACFGVPIADKIHELMLALENETNETSELKRELEETTKRLNEVLNRSEEAR